MLRLDEELRRLKQRRNAYEAQAATAECKVKEGQKACEVHVLTHQLLHAPFDCI